jgi:hypothetical protein
MPEDVLCKSLEHRRHIAFGERAVRADDELLIDPLGACQRRWLGHCCGLLVFGCLEFLAAAWAG